MRQLSAKQCYGHQSVPSVAEEPPVAAANAHLAGYWTPEQLAARLGVSIRTLSRWHAQGEGPPKVSFGKLALYRVAAVEQWLALQEIQSVRARRRPTQLRGKR